MAILIQTLDEAEADRLLEQMTLEQAADVREMAESLDDVGDAERLTVVNEFLRATGRKPLPELAFSIECHDDAERRSRTRAIRRSRAAFRDSNPLAAQGSRDRFNPPTRPACRTDVRRAQ
ncbi:MAG: hypothetical protein R3B96_09045 [Pirellulaceae bacterium]